jgi:hypothetical protein
VVASSLATVCWASASPVAAGLAADAGALAGPLLVFDDGLVLGGGLALELPPELQAASSAAAVTAIPGASKCLRLSVIAYYLRHVPPLARSVY